MSRMDNIDLIANFRFRDTSGGNIGDMEIIRAVVGAPDNPLIFISAEPVEGNKPEIHLNIDVTEFPPDVLGDILVMLGENLKAQQTAKILP